MPRATNQRDRPHARIYANWMELDAWRDLSGNATKLLCVMLASYRPGRNGRLEWSERQAGEAIGMSPATGRRAIEELECAGWIAVERIGSFGRRDKPTCYALSMYKNDVTLEPPTHAYLHPTTRPQGRGKRPTVRHLRSSYASQAKGDSVADEGRHQSDEHLSAAPTQGKSEPD